MSRKSPNDEIWYTSLGGNAVAPNATNVFGANIVSNNYSNGKGIIKFDGDVTSIGDYAFKGCTGLTSIIIPNSVTSIGNMAFYECKGIISVTIPNSVTSIKNQAFYFCTSLTSVKVEATTPLQLWGNAFNRCPDLIEILVPSASVDAYKAASGWSNYASKIRGF